MPPQTAAMELATCAAAFQAWVDRTASANTPGTNPIAVFISAQQAERRVFELCSLEEAEAHNRAMKIQDAPGIDRPLIEPDIRTFADAECVDDVELLGGTPLCAEIGR